MKTAIPTIIFFTLFALTAAGYVDLFKNADFEIKLARVEDVVIDVCYTFKCKNSRSLDNLITSAKWHGLPEKGQFFGEKGDATIKFYTELNCKGDDKSWLIKTQSSKKLYFPENFRLDDMNDAISSFKVINAGGVAGVLSVCAERESAVVTNATSNDGSGASANDTVTYF
ncbi:Epsin-1, required for endocytosis and actin patch assembly [Phytophthora pseudosyringae]|uniref:Epsin-1, required for endocytosis and actin patch assembly n=1 Tax=Phytophthora pseudosyringae TaxID=221518 RepID=A0A8T1VQR0_9STRA|nr:Epsin-1, required for endocytosis and actin patch assembly [Phytophthora pseudosyringae]